MQASLCQMEFTVDLSRTASQIASLPFTQPCLFDACSVRLSRVACNINLDNYAQSCHSLLNALRPLLVTALC